jgi:hypothetical protein
MENDDPFLIQTAPPAGSAPAATAQPPPASDDPFLLPPPPTASPLSDIGNSALSGLEEGTLSLPGIPGDIQRAAQTVGTAIGTKLREAVPPSTFGWKPMDIPAPPHLPLPTSSDVQSAVSDATGWTPYKPQTTAGQYAHSAASFVPAAAAAALSGGGSFADTALGALKYGVVPGVTSEAAGQLTKGTPYESAARFAGAAIPSAGLGLLGNAGRLAPDVAPSIDDIKAASQNLYRQADAQNLVVEQPSWAAQVGSIAADMKKAGIHPKITPAASAALDEVQATANTAPTLQEIDQLHQIIGNVARSTDPNEARLGGMMSDKIDGFMQNLQPNDVLSGDPVAAASTIQGARQLWAIKSKAQAISDLFNRAQNAAGANYTTAGMETALRQQFRQLASNPAKMDRFNPDEQQLILQVVRGGPVQNAVRAFGKFAPHGVITGGLAAAIGHAAGVVPAAAYTGATWAARDAASKMTLANAAAVDRAVRQSAVGIGGITAKAPGLSGALLTPPLNNIFYASPLLRALTGQQNEDDTLRQSP